MLTPLFPTVKLTFIQGILTPFFSHELSSTTLAAFSSKQMCMWLWEVLNLIFAQMNYANFAETQQETTQSLTCVLVRVQEIECSPLAPELHPQQPGRTVT